MSKISINDYHLYIAPLIKACEKKRCHEYCKIIQADKQNVKNSLEKNEALNLFDKITSYSLVPDSINEPFKPILILFAEEQRSPIPDDLTPEERDFLQQVLPEIKDTELKARVADTLWVLKHNKPKVQKNAKTAIEAYLVFDEMQLDEHWFDILDKLARALRIFDNIRLFEEKKVPKKLDAPKKISECIESNIARPYLVMRLIELLHKTHRPYNDKHVKILETIATNDEKNLNYQGAKDVWDLTASLYKQEKNTDEAIRCQVNAAETYVKQADIVQAMQNPSYMSISGFLQSAVEAYRTIPNTKERRDEIYEQLVHAQSKISNEMQSFSTKIDFSDAIKSAKKRVSGLDVSDAIYEFAFITRPPHLKTVKKEVKDLEQKYVLSSLVSGQHHNHKGHVLFKSSIDSDINDKMHHHIKQFHRNTTAICVLIPALQQIRLEHNISLFDWQSVIKDHPFIPPERMNVYAHGLFHGFHGDFLSAAHILIPQIENSIRYLLNNNGKQTSKQITGGIQKEDSLNQTLEDDELKNLFRKDLIFDLQGLLIKKEGENMRNNLMHGFLDDGQLFTPEMVYLYWLTLHIIFIPFRKLPTPKPQD